MYKILIGEISSNKAIVIAKYLKKTYRNIIIYSYDNLSYTNRLHTKYVDKHIFVEKKTLSSYLDGLISIVSELEIDLFLPIHSNYIGVIIKEKDKFGKSLFYLGDYQDYESLHIKDKLQKIAREIGIDVPREYKTMDSVYLPFVGKPVDKSSSKGVIYFNTEKEIQKNNTKLDNYIFQEYINGVGCGYSLYAKNGIIQTGYAHKRVLEYPYRGGSSIYREGFIEKGMKEVAEKILYQIKWTGFAMFEFKYTQDGRFVLIEVNPRLWGSVNQGLLNGVNYFSSLIPIGNLRKGKIINKEIKTYMSPQIYLSLLQSVFYLKISKLIYILKNIRRNKADVSLFDDIRGYLSIILRALFKYFNEK